MKENKRKTGAKYERIAAEYLEEQGCQILRQNYQCRLGEIDLVVWEDGYLVFAEVKYRKNAQNGSAAMAVNANKQKKISRTADHYMKENQILQNQSVRFDVVAIDGEKITWIKDAFPYAGNVRF